METNEQPKMLDLAERKKQIETSQSRPKDLSTKKSISIGLERTLYVQCKQWGDGQKFLSLSKSKSKWSDPKYLPSILVPQDAYKIVAKMDEVIRQLPVEEPQHPEGDEPLVLATQIVDSAEHYDGRHYEFKLWAWHQNGDEWHFNIQSRKTSNEHKHTEMLYLPFWALPELRQEMVQILEQHDGTELIEEMPKIPEWATREKAETENKEKESELGPNENADESLKLAEASLDLGQNGKNRQLDIKCDRGKSGQKTIEISMPIPKESTTIHLYFPKIRVPQEAYKFLEAIDGLIFQLPVDTPPIPARNMSGQRQILKSQMVECEEGQDHDFELSVVWHQKDGEWDVYIRSVQKLDFESEKQKEQQLYLYFPLSALSWLREQMTAMLEEHDGSKQIPKMPTIPEWATLGRAAPKVELQWQQLEQEQVIEKKADDADEHCPCGHKWSDCWRCMPKSSGLPKRQPFQNKRPRHASK